MMAAARNFFIVVTAVILCGCIFAGQRTAAKYLTVSRTTDKSYTISDWQKVEGEWQCLKSDFYVSSVETNQ